uniref:SVWC domain-containing protein n=1 Tax=Steinernema glaseri TaxID=37863 RepID=A0A1I8A7F0_9BILA
MKIQLLLLLSLALPLAAPVRVNKDHLFVRYPEPCYNEKGQCRYGYFPTDSYVEGNDLVLFCCESQSLWSDKSVCYERIIFTFGCPAGYERNNKWFTSSILWKWCCPSPQQ